MNRQSLPLLAALPLVVLPALAAPPATTPAPPPLNGAYKGTYKENPRDPGKPMTLTISGQKQARFQCKIVAPQAGTFQGSGEITPAKKVILRAKSTRGVALRLEGTLDPRTRKLSGKYEAREGDQVEGRGAFSVTRSTGAP